MAPALNQKGCFNARDNRRPVKICRHGAREIKVRVRAQNRGESRVAPNQPSKEIAKRSVLRTDEDSLFASGRAKYHSLADLGLELSRAPSPSPGVALKASRPSIIGLAAVWIGKDLSSEQPHEDAGHERTETIVTVDKPCDAALAQHMRRQDLRSSTSSSTAFTNFFGGSHSPLENT